MVQPVSGYLSLINQISCAALEEIFELFVPESVDFCCRFASFEHFDSLNPIAPRNVSRQRSLEKRTPKVLPNNDHSPDDSPPRKNNRIKTIDTSLDFASRRMQNLNFAFVLVAGSPSASLRFLRFRPSFRYAPFRLLLGKTNKSRNGA